MDEEQIILLVTYTCHDLGNKMEMEWSAKRIVNKVICLPLHVSREYESFRKLEWSAKRMTSKVICLPLTRVTSKMTWKWHGEQTCFVRYVLFGNTNF